MTSNNNHEGIIKSILVKQDCDKNSKIVLVDQTTDTFKQYVDNAYKAIHNHHSSETGRSENFPNKHQSSTTRGNVCYGVQRKNENSNIHSVEEFSNVYVVNSSNQPSDYLKWQKLIDLSMNPFTAGKLSDEVQKQPIVNDLITESDVDEVTMMKIKLAFINTPPCLVNDTKNSATDSYGITSKQYVKFILDVFDILKKTDITEAQTESAGGTHTKRDALATKISKVLGHIMEKWHEEFKSRHTDEVEYISIDRLGRKSNITTKTFKQAFRHQVSIIVATLFTAIKTEDVFSHHCNPIKWSFERITPKHKPTIEIKTATGLPSKIELTQLLSIKKTKRDNDDVRIVMAEKLAKIHEEEATKITDADKKKLFTDVVVPGVKDYVTKYFTHNLLRDHTAGISSIKTLLADTKPDSLFGELLDKLHDEAKQALECKKMSEATIEVESDGEDVILPICSHKVKVIEPPSFSEDCRNIHKFNPPIYRLETHGDFIDFMEGTALRYIRKFPQMTYKDRGIAIWWVLKSDRQKNTFMKTFGKFLNNVALTNEKEFQNLYVMVSRKLFPEQDKTPIDYQNLMTDRDWLIQSEDEDFDELLDRIRDCLENAYPNEHMSDVNRVRLADAYYQALRDRFYQKYIDEHLYDEFFNKGKINHVVTQLNKKKRMRLEQKKRKENNILNVNAVLKNETNQSKKHQSRQGFRLGNPENVRLKNGQHDHEHVRQDVSYVENNYNKKNDARNFKTRDYPQSRNRGNYKSYENTPREQNQNYRGHNSNTNKPALSDLKKEIMFLTRNKNINPKGGFWISEDQIDSKVKNSPGFDIRNFVPEKQYKMTVDQALRNLEDKQERNQNSRAKAVRTRQNRRKSQSSFRRKNVVINRREVNQVTSNLFRISSEITMQILKLSKENCEVPEAPVQETDSYKVMIGCGDRSSQTTVKAIIDSGAGVNLAGAGIYQKLKQYGTFMKTEELTSVPKLRGASSDQLNVSGALTLDINIGKRTTYKNCRVLVSDSVPSNFFVLGTEFLTDLKHQLSFLFSPLFHRSDCENSGKNQIFDSCTEDCAVTTNSMILNPSSTLDCDIVNFIPNSSSYVRFLEYHQDPADSEENVLALGTFDTSKNQALKMRFVTDRKISVLPNSMQAISVKPQEETWNPNTERFVWTDMAKHDQNILVLAEPTSFLEKSGLMNSETEEAVYSVADNVFMVKNHSSKEFQIGDGTAVANIYIIV